LFFDDIRMPFCDYGYIQTATYVSTLIARTPHCIRHWCTVDTYRTTQRKRWKSKILGRKQVFIAACIYIYTNTQQHNDMLEH